jgi:hypothetical protein
MAELGDVSVFHRWAPLIVNFLIFLSAFAYSIVAGCQLKAMRRQGEIMREQLKLQGEQIQVVRTLQEQSDRPWVLVSSIELGTAPKVGAPIIVAVLFTNSGRTPANNVDAQTWITVTGEKDMGKFERPESRMLQSKSVVPPGAVTGIQKVSTTGPGATEVDVEAINTGKRSIFVYGRVSYDVPGGKGETDFCYQYLPSWSTFAAYREGNYAK